MLLRELFSALYENKLKFISYLNKQDHWKWLSFFFLSFFGDFKRSWLQWSLENDFEEKFWLADFFSLFFYFLLIRKFCRVRFERSLEIVRIFKVLAILINGMAIFITRCLVLCRVSKHFMNLWDFHQILVLLTLKKFLIE